MRHHLGSPNFSSRNGVPVSLLVLHYTGMQSGKAAISRLCEAAAQVSAHYVVDEDGSIYPIVDESDCAWHAGVSYWRGHRNVNNISVGIEIVNPGHEWGYRAYPGVQMQAVAKLSRQIISRHAILPCNIVAHSDIAPQRKEDPGELFDWQWLAGEEVGLWPEVRIQNAEFRKLKSGDNGGAVLEMQKSLALYGYEVPQNSIFDDSTKKVAIAFQRHFRQNNIAGEWDSECHAKLNALLGAI